MYALVGQSINPDGHTFSSWIVGYSKYPSSLMKRINMIQNTLNDQGIDAFFSVKDNIINKKNINYATSLKIQDILTQTGLDPNYNSITPSGFRYDIVRIEEIG